MNSAIADIVKGYVQTLPFVGKIAGLVRTITISNEVADGKFIKKSFPVACNVTHTDCVTDTSKLTELIPNTSYKSVIYFEDLGTTPTDNGNKYFDFESRIKLVCWLNLPALGKTDCSVSHLAIGAILKALPENNINSGDFSHVKINMTSEDIKSSAIFSKYTYPEEAVQYLMYPYDYFAINLAVSYRLPYKCIDDWTNGTAINCP